MQVRRRFAQHRQFADVELYLLAQLLVQRFVFSERYLLFVDLIPQIHRVPHHGKADVYILPIEGGEPDVQFPVRKHQLSIGNAASRFELARAHIIADLRELPAEDISVCTDGAIAFLRRIWRKLREVRAELHALLAALILQLGGGVEQRIQLALARGAFLDGVIQLWHALFVAGPDEGLNGFVVLLGVGIVVDVLLAQIHLVHAAEERPDRALKNGNVFGVGTYRA